jgi:hypothetical protein
MIRHFNSVHIPTLFSATSLQSTYWHNSQPCHSSSHTDTTLSHVTPVHILTQLSAIWFLSTHKCLTSARYLLILGSQVCLGPSRGFTYTLTKIKCIFLISCLHSTWQHDSFCDLVARSYGCEGQPFFLRCCHIIYLGQSHTGVCRSQPYLEENGISLKQRYSSSDIQNYRQKYPEE